MLETLVPKVPGDQVMVVLGQWAGRVSCRPRNGGRGTRERLWSGLALLTLPTPTVGGPSAGPGQSTEPGSGTAAERRQSGGASL